MSKTHDALEFYAKNWEKNRDGILVPTLELLRDQGMVAKSAIHAAPKEVQPENIVQSVFRISTAEISEALRDLLLAMNMQPGEHRTMTIGHACTRLQNAEHRIRSVNRA